MVSTGGENAGERCFIEGINGLIIMSLLQGRIWVLRNSPLGTQQRSPDPWSSNALDFRRPHMEWRVVRRGNSCHPGMVEDAYKLFSLFYFSSASFETWVKSQRVARLNKEKDLFSQSLRSSLVVFTLHSWSQWYPLLWGAADAGTRMLSKGSDSFEI